MSSNGNYFNLSKNDLDYLIHNMSTDPKLTKVSELYDLYVNHRDAPTLGLLTGAVREWERNRNRHRQCKFCGTNGPHYCPNDVAKD